MKKVKFIVSSILLVSLTFLVSCKSKENKEEVKKETVVVEVEEIVIEDDRELPTVSIKKNDRITSPQEIKVNSQGIWLAHEGELGWVQLKDSEGNELAKGILMAEGEWMKEGPVMFSTKLTFDAKDKRNGVLVIHNNPGPGDGNEAGEEISFEIPVIF